MSLVKSVQVAVHPAARLEQVIGGERQARLLRAADEFRARLGGRTIWNVSSTAVGGGVAEMLRVLVGYVEDLGIAIGWVVISGDAEFFAITKRLHNQIHGQMAGGPLSEGEADHYAQMLAANVVELAPRIRPGDLVLLHDPQTAGLARALAAEGARVAWRSHIGVDWENGATQAAWEFLRPHLDAAEAYVFSRRQYVPAWVPSHQVWIIPPSIDPFSPKNQDLDGRTVEAILATIGVLDGAALDGRTAFARSDGGTGAVTRSAEITGEGRPGRADPLVVQVSRWDRLKDMPGVMAGFAGHGAAARPGWPRTTQARLRRGGGTPRRGTCRFAGAGAQAGSAPRRCRHRGRARRVGLDGQSRRPRRSGASCRAWDDGSPGPSAAGGLYGRQPSTGTRQHGETCSFPPA